MVDQPLLVFFVGMLSMLGLIAIHIPIGISMIVVGVIGTGWIIGFGPTLSLLAVEPVAALTTLDLAAIPLFLLLGSLAGTAGISADIYNLANAFFGRRRGGLAMATVAGSAGFGAICGSSVATTASMAKIALPEMEKRGYAPGLASGSIAAGGSLGILIPPSVIMVIYAVLTEQFVIDLFIAGVIPGIVSVILYMLAISIVVKRNPETAPTGASISFAEKWSTIKSAWRAITIIFVVTFGIYAGIFTVMEAASVGVFVTAVFWYFSSGRSWSGLKSVAKETFATTGMVFLMVVGANVLGYFVSLTDAANIMVAAISASGLPPFGIILALLCIYIFLGAIFDSVASMILTMPFVFPLILELGYDPIWWGIINVMIIEIGGITPPLGMNVFVMHASAPHLGLKTIFRGITPFLMADVVRIAIFLLFPALVTFLPNLMR